MSKKLDSLDEGIAKLLAEDARMSASQISETLGDVTERTVRNRITSLIERRILLTTAVLDPVATGRVYLDLNIDTAPGKMADVADRLVDLPQIDMVSYGGGSHDVYAYLLAESLQFGLALVEEVDRIPGVISVKVTTHMAVLKSHGFRLRAADDLRARLNEERGD